MTKVLKSLVLLLAVFCVQSNANAQCDSETVNSSLHVSFDDCVSNTTNGTNVDYSEFTATYSNNNVCNNVSLIGGNIYRNNPQENPHSCTPGVNDTPGMCIGYSTDCSYIPGTDQAVRFDVLIDPTSGSSSLTSLSFYELSSPIFQYINGNNGQNNRPLYYAIRVLSNGQEIFHETDIATTQEWSLESFDFSNIAAFSVSSPTTFNFELTAYCADYIGGAVSVWDLDELTVSTSCKSSTIDLDANIQIAGDQTASSCNGTTFNFVTGSNPTGAVCTWYFNWPSTDPSTVFVGANPVYTFPEEGIYTIRKEVVLGDCFASDELIVSAFNNGVIGNGVNGNTDGFDVNVVACNGALVDINLVSTAFDQNDGYEVNSWSWTITVNGVTQSASGPEVSLVLSNVDDVIISLLATSTSGCQNTFTESFNVGDLFPLSSFVAVLEECTDSGYIISITDNTNTTDFTIESYEWSLIVDGQVFDPGNVNAFTFETVNDLFDISHLVYFTNGCTGQSNSQSISVEDDLVPDFDIAIVTDSIGGGGNDCTSQSLEIIPTGGSINGNITSIEWVVTVAGMTFNFTGNPIDLEGIITEPATVTATINYDNGCSFTVSETIAPSDFPGGTGSLNVTFNGNPVIDCEGEETPLLIDPNPNYVYTWSPTDGLSFTDNVNFSDPVVSVSEVTTYAVTVTDGACTFVGSVIVVPEELANPSIDLDGSGSNNNEFCDGVISASVTNPIAGVEYEWSCGDDFAEIIGTGTSIVYDAGVFSSKEFCVRIANTNPACDIHTCATVLGQPNFDLNFNGNPVIDCNDDVTPVLLNPNPNYTYTWDPTDGLSFTDMINFSDPTVSVSEITTYNLTVTDGECMIDTSILVIPEDLAIPEVDLLGLGVNENIFCNGIIEIVVTNPIDGVEYEWSCGSDFIDIIAVGDSLIYDAGLDFDVKEICVRIEGADAACDISTCIDVINGHPNLEYVNPLVMCPGDTIQYEIINNNDEDIVIVFEDDPHIIEFDENGLPIIGVGENEDIFGIPFTVTNEFCVLVDTLIVEPSENQQLDFEWTIEECGELTICFDALNIDPDNGVPFWDFGDPTTDSDTSSIFNPCYTYPDTGFYNVVLMDFSELCPGITDTMEIEVAAEPWIQIINGDTLFFEEYPVILESETNGDPETIIWCDEDGNPIGNGPSIEISEGDSLCIFAKITDQFECSDTAKILLIMDEGKFNDIDGIEGPDEAVCANDTLTLNLLVDNPEDYTYNWGPSDCVLSGGDSIMPTVSVGTESKEFSVTVTDIASMMDSVFNYFVEVNVLDIEIECSFEDGVINWGSEGTISVISPANATYEWSTGETGSSITISPTENTSYSVTVTDENGCTGVETKSVEVMQVNCSEEGVFLPTAFSPNSDGINDVFRLRSLWIDSISVFIVYDRWGEEVYNANGNFTSGWDGTFDGVELAPDVYAFCVKGVCIDGTEFTRVGNVSLMK